MRKEDSNISSVVMMKDSSNGDSDDEEIMDIKKDRRVNRFKRRIVKA